MKQTEYSLANLWPEFTRVFQGDITSAEGLSALFVLILIAGSLVFSLMSLWNFYRANNHLRFYRHLIKGLNAEELLEKRRDITNKAMENKRYGRLWREFDESLVHVPQKQRLCNTLDAAHFFNTHSLARGLTENRLLAAVPGFLTAIGVIGTFAGLQMGLSSLSENMGLTPQIDELTLGIFGMIGGASIAFMTSVWGVFTSVLFNFYEKFLERNIRASITSFQNDVDYLYPRITAEQSLTNIEDFSRQSTEKLAELDEKIGHKMQEAMREASAAISEGVAQSLNAILEPAIKQLVDGANSGSEKALESLLERFLAGVGTAGDAQREMMEKAAMEIAAASGGMKAGLDGFSEKLDNQIGSFMADVSDQLKALANDNANTMKSVQGELAQQIEDQQGREIARQKILHDQLRGFQGAQEKISSSIGGVLETQQRQSDELHSGLSGLIDRFEQLSVSHVNATQSMQSVAADLKSTSNQLGLLSGNLKSASDILASSITNAVNQADNVTEQNKGMLEAFSQLATKFDGIHDNINNTSQTLNSAAEKAESGLVAVDKHFESLANSLKQHVADLENQVANLLDDYAERVQAQTVDRLSTWNKETNSYIASMTNAIGVINDVVDEIDGKVRSRREGSLA